MMNVAVIGAGCGGQAIAGYLASQGHDVNLYNRSMARIGPIMDSCQIRLRGAYDSVGDISLVTNNMPEAVYGADMIMVVTTATGHKDIANLMADHLKDGQAILLNPGRTCGALEFQNTLYQRGCYADVAVGEANTLLYIARADGNGNVDIGTVKKEVSFSALRLKDQARLYDRLNALFSEFTPVDSFLDTSFGNIGAIFHPTIMLFNKDKVLAGEVFDFYIEGTQNGVAEYLEEVDNEMANVAKALGSKALSLKHWLGSRYGIEAVDLTTMIRSNVYYQGLKSPTTLEHRYILEDVPTGLVPVSSFGRALGIGTPLIDTLIEEACDALNRDFRQEGRTIENLGLRPEYLKDDIEFIVGRREEAA